MSGEEQKPANGESKIYRERNGTIQGRQLKSIDYFPFGLIPILNKFLNFSGARKRKQNESLFERRPCEALRSTGNRN